MRLRLRIAGRVQGVGFRYFARGTAERCFVSGWVRNEADGSVSCEVQGEADAVEQFVAAVREGPRYSRVESFESETVADEPSANRGFEIR